VNLSRKTLDFLQLRDVTYYTFVDFLLHYNLEIVNSDLAISDFHELVKKKISLFVMRHSTVGLSRSGRDVEKNLVAVTSACS
jgi:hypothetical protein